MILKTGSNKTSPTESAEVEQVRVPPVYLCHNCKGEGNFALNVISEQFGMPIFDVDN